MQQEKKKSEESYKIESSANVGLKNRRVAIQGPPGSGKTCLASTMSQFDEGHLEDVLWVPFDTNATASLSDRRVRVDQIPVADIFADMPLPKALEKLTDMIYDAKHEIIVIDTPTKLDKMIVRYWGENAPLTNRGARDSFAIWREVVSMHDRFHTNLDLLNKDLVWCMHSKPRSESDLASKKQKAAGLPGNSYIRPDFMYEDVVNIYRRDTDLILVTECNIKGGKYEYNVYSDPHQGFEAKCRFRNSLGEGKHEPNLKAIYKKITDKLNGEK